MRRSFLGSPMYLWIKPFRRGPPTRILHAPSSRPATSFAYVCRTNKALSEAGQFAYKPLAEWLPAPSTNPMFLTCSHARGHFLLPFSNTTRRVHKVVPEIKSDMEPHLAPFRRHSSIQSAFLQPAMCYTIDMIGGPWTALPTTQSFRTCLAARCQVGTTNSCLLLRPAPNWKNGH